MIIRRIITAIAIALLFFAEIFYYFYSRQEPKISFVPQVPKAYAIDSSQGKTPLNIQATTLPQFKLSANDEKFKNIWQEHAMARDALVTTSVTSAIGGNMKVNTQFDENKKEISIAPQQKNTFKPGLYKLNVTLKTINGEYITITQDFTWGVLAVNTNKPIYKPGDTVKIGMGVLDDIGDTKCIAEGDIKFETAKVWLKITSPTDKVQDLSTDDGSIIGSRECGPKTVTNVADFSTKIIADEIGKYKITMTAENINGKRSIEDFFTVQNAAPRFDIERVSYPTRIYPKHNYPIEMTVIAGEDYKGPVADVMPSSFEIYDISDSGETRDHSIDGYQTVLWQVNWKKGQTYTLKYKIHFPPVSPDFYLIGPLRVGDFSEGRQWHIASDSVFTLVQEKNNTTASAQTVTATFNSTPGQGHLLIANCYRTTSDPAGGFLSLTSGGSSMDIGTPAGYSTAENNSNSTSNTTGVVWMFYKIAGASEATSVRCDKTNDNTQNGPMGIQILEFSGGSSTITLDTAAGSHSNVDQTTGCNTGSFQNATNSITPTNSNALIISAFMARAASRTYNSHTNSFIDADISGGSNGFNNATAGSYTTGYLELGTAAARSDTITLSAAGTACANVIATFNTGNNFTQGGFRFFENADSTTPGAPLAAANNNAVLTQRRFRVRMLLDNDSATGMTLPVNGGDWKLQFATLPPGGACSAQTYSTVTTSSTIAYADNPSVAVGANIASQPGIDPADAGYTTRLESYYDNPNTGGTPPNITNDQLTIATLQAGLWDFSLIDNTGLGTNATYCLRIINGNGTTLNTYDFYPQITNVISGVNIRGGTLIQGGTLLR